MEPLWGCQMPRNQIGHTKFWPLQVLSNGIDIFEKQIYLESSPERDICRVDASQIKGYEEIRARINFHFANLRKKWLYWMQVLRWNIYVSTCRHLLSFWKRQPSAKGQNFDFSLASSESQFISTNSNKNTSINTNTKRQQTRGEKWPAVMVCYQVSCKSASQCPTFTIPAISSCS